MGAVIRSPWITEGPCAPFRFPCGCEMKREERGALACLVWLPCAQHATEVR